jgi:hypothetical protein
LPAPDPQLHKVLSGGIFDIGGMKPWACMHPFIQICFLGIYVAIEVDDADFFIS